MKIFYNEWDEYAAQWLRNLGNDGHIPSGEVCEKSITELKGSDLDGYAQCHFFAGIGGWPLALKMSGLDCVNGVWTGSPPCFPKGHMVLLDRGFVPIEDVKVGDMAVTHTGRLRRVARTGSKTAPVGRLRVVGLPDGIVCTPDHKFLSRNLVSQNTKRDGKYARIETISEPAYVKASEMPGKQWMALTNMEAEAPPFPDGITPQEAMRLAGYYLGDGWVTHDGCEVCFGLNDRKFAEFSRDFSSFPYRSNAQRTTIRVTVYRRQIAEWLRSNFGSGAGQKRIPTWALAHQHRSDLFEGYRKTDGHTGLGGDTVEANSISRALAYGFAMLSQTLGYVATVREVKTADSTVIEGRVVNQKNYWSVKVFSADRSRKSRVRDGKILRKASTFEMVGDAQVYDIEVEDDHSYILDGAIVSNCQPFSRAGKELGVNDERHLAPTWFQLIREEKPTAVFGEQVAAAISHGWVDELFSLLEGEGYSCGFAVLSGCVAGSPTKRDRIFFGAVQMANAGEMHGAWNKHRLLRQRERNEQEKYEARPPNTGFCSDFWKDYEIQTSEYDSKNRICKPGIPLLVNGIPGTMGGISGYGNAIVPQVATVFIDCFMEAVGDMLENE